MKSSDPTKDIVWKVRASHMPNLLGEHATLRFYRKLKLSYNSYLIVIVLNHFHEG